MNIEDQLNAFKKIEQVEAPPFLLAKIKHRIAMKQELPVSKPVKWAFALSVILMVALNFGVWLKTNTNTSSSSNNMSSLASGLNLNTQIDFYHEQN